MGFLPGHLGQNVFHRLYRESDLDFGQLCKIQTMQEPQLHITGQLDYSKVSIWIKPLLKQDFVVRKGCTSTATCQGSLLQNYLIYLVPVKHKLSFTMTDSFLFLMTVQIYPFTMTSWLGKMIDEYSG